MKQSRKNGIQMPDPDISEEDNQKTNLELYGKWQLEPLQLPHAVNGIVPKVCFHCYASSHLCFCILILAWYKMGQSVQTGICAHVLGYNLLYNPLFHVFALI